MRHYGGLNQPRGISRDTGVQLPGHKPLLAHEVDGDEFVRASAIRLSGILYGHHDDRGGLYDLYDLVEPPTMTINTAR